LYSPRHIPTNVLSGLGIVRIILLSRVIFQDLVVEDWDVRIVLAVQHLLQEVVAELHHLLANVPKEGIT
jgi:hypothetical protein